MTEPSGKARAPKTDSTLSKGLLILEALAAARGAKGVSELARELDLTKSNVFRLLQSLTVLGYVRPTDDKRYAATLKTWQVGRAVVDNFNLRDIAAEEMQGLSAETGEAIYLAVPEGLTVVYIDKIESTQPIRSWNPIAGSAPLHGVGTGKAILAAEYDRMRGRMIGNLTRYTDRTLTKIEDLDAEMATIQTLGYAIDTGEFRERIRSYGAAIFLPNGTAIAALGISAPEVNLDDQSEARYCALVKSAAERVSRKLRQS